MSDKVSKIKREIISWILPLAIFGIIYVTGLHRHMAAGLQKVVVATGIIKPETNLNLDEKPNVNYNFRLKSVNGLDLHFEELKGKVVFINFWATWCPPCLAEMPDIHDLYQSLDEDKIEFVMISRDKAFGRAKKYVQKEGYTFPIYQLVDPLPTSLSFDGIPTTFVISKDGKIALKNTGIATYNTRKFKEYLLTLANS